MKKVFALMIAGMMMLAASAQSVEIKWSAGADLAIPMGDLADISDMGFGGQVAADFMLGNGNIVEGEFTYLLFAGKSEDGFDYPDSTGINLFCNYKKDFNGFYLLVGPGFYMFSVDAEGAGR